MEKVMDQNIKSEGRSPLTRIFYRLPFKIIWTAFEKKFKT